MPEQTVIPATPETQVIFGAVQEPAPSREELSYVNAPLKEEEASIK